MYAFSWQNSISLCPASFRIPRPNLPVTPGVSWLPIFAFQSPIVMSKSRNLPMITREPISDAKAREFLLPSSSWGSHRYRCSSYREEPWALGYIAYIGYYRGKNSKNGSLRVWLVTFWWRGRCWILIGSPFPGLTPISRAGQGFWLVRRWWGEVRGFPKALFPEPYKME